MKSNKQEKDRYTMKKYSIILAIAIMATSIAYSRPEYSLLQSYGAKCESCHTNVRGGGGRTLGGWMSRNQTSVIPPKVLGLTPVFDFLQQTNSVLDDKISFGMDFRWQTARWGTRSGKTERDYMVMQLSPYLSIRPIKYLELEGMYNFGYDLNEKMRYPGQQPGTFSVYIRPGEKLPSLRVGYFQAPVGLVWDDHTIMSRQLVAGGTPSTLPLLLPHDMTEWGAQIDYEAIPWLGVSLGVFDSENLSTMLITDRSNKMVPLVNGKSLSTVANVRFYPPEFITGVSSFCGVSYMINSPLKTDDGWYFGNDYLAVTNIYGGIGLIDKLALLIEYQYSDKQATRTTDNISAELTYQPIEGAYAYVRAERGHTNDKVANVEHNSNQFVFGAKVFLLPYIAILPEYRLYNREWVEGYSGQWAFQVHIFY